MPLYEYECVGPKHKEVYEFTAILALKDIKDMPECEKCSSSEHVKKVIRTAFPKSQSWRA